LIQHFFKKNACFSSAQLFSCEKGRKRKKRREGMVGGIMRGRKGRTKLLELLLYSFNQCNHK